MNLGSWSARCHLVAAFIVVAALTGCTESQQTQSDAKPPTEGELATRQFENIVAEIKRRFKDRRNSRLPVGGGPMLKWTTEIAEELMPPASEGLAWRGEITVTKQSSVTVISVPDPEAEEEQEETPRFDGDSGGEFGAADGTSLEDLATPSRRTPRQLAPVMQVIDEDNVEVYKLIFEDGSWRLVTEVDEDTEMGLVFRLALKSQKFGS